MEKSHPGEFEQGLAIWEGGNKEARIREDCGKSIIKFDEILAMVVEAVVGAVQALIIRHTTRLTHTTSGELIHRYPLKA